MFTLIDFKLLNAALLELGDLTETIGATAGATRLAHTRLAEAIAALRAYVQKDER